MMPTDKNECSLNNNNCAQKSTCLNLPGSHECLCPQGYQGQFCDEGDSLFSNIFEKNYQNTFTSSADIDECELETVVCENNSTCTNTIGDFNCVCSENFRGRNCSIG